ncbi:MAG: ABC transporter substrate-binding protein, partial [Spirochaetota bacterium]
MPDEKSVKVCLRKGDLIMKQRKVLAFVVVSLLILSVAVFAGGKGEEKAAGGKVTLTMLDLNPEGAPFIDALNKGFMEKYPNIVIEYEAMSSRQYDQRIQALAASNDLPDIVTTQMFPQYKQMAGNNLFMDLTDTAIVKSGIFDNIAATCLVKNEKVYGLTWNHLAVGAFYNKDTFDKFGLSIPKDWDEFLKVCETLKKNGVTPIVSDLGDGWTCMY